MNKDINLFSPLPIYEISKEYFPFFFPETSHAYFSTEAAQNLFEIIFYKETANAFSLWKEVLREIKDSTNNKVFYLKDAKPSLTGFIKKSNNEKILFSISLLGDFYTILQVSQKNSNTIIKASPDGIKGSFFHIIEEIIEKKFPSHRFVCLSLLRMNFFNLIVPNENFTNTKNGFPDTPANVLNALFFKLNIKGPNFILSGEQYYKTIKSSPYLPLEKIELMKNTIFNDSVIEEEVF